MLGFRPEELVGSRWTELLSLDELDAVRVQQPGLVENNPSNTLPPQSLEVRLRAAAGDWHTVDVTITDLRDEPAVQGIVLNARDVTLRKELEHNLRHQALHDALTGLANRTHVRRARQRIGAAPHAAWPACCSSTSTTSRPSTTASATRSATSC